jgi:hypothetical protein
LPSAGSLVAVPAPRTIRYVGLTGSVLLALAAYLGGAGYTRGLSITPARMVEGPYGVLLTACWLVGTALLIGAWWVGRNVVPSTRWALVTVALWLAPVLPFLPMGSEDVYSYACQGYVQFAGGDPYAAGPLQQGCPWTDSVAELWRDSPAPYGPLFLLLASLAVQVGGSLTGAVVGLRLVAVAGVALTAVALPVLARRAGVPPERAVWLALASPLVLVHLVSGAHNDALMIGLLVSGLAVAASRRTAGGLFAGSVLVGLAVAVKATAVVVLPFAVLLLVPPGARLRELWRPAAVATGGLLAAMGAVSALSGRGIGWIAGLSRSGDTIEWTSPSTALGLAVQYSGRWVGIDVQAVSIARAVGVVVLAGVLVALWWWAQRGHALLGAGLALAATVVLAPVFHPWYATWPLAVLAATWAGDRVTLDRWLLLPCAVAAVLTLPAGYNLALVTRVQGSLLMTAGMVALAVWTIRRRRTRRHTDTPALAPAD